MISNNPVLQHELLGNLRKPRAFVLLFLYVGLLGLMVYLAWPQQQLLDMAQPEAAKRLVNLFFLVQFLLASLMAPSFTAGAISGEKERKSYEMLLATPLKPRDIVFGKLGAALTHLGILMICSLPIVMLCLPLGGVLLYEVFAAYIGMISGLALFGMISLWSSSYFAKTSASLAASYLFILPLALLGVLLWNFLEPLGMVRLTIMVTAVPLTCFVLIAVMWSSVCRRLLHPADLGSEGKEVVNLDSEAREAVGLYIERNAFPDRYFAPPKRSDFLPDDVNPIFDKEMRSEIFSQGTLMLRLVIQISMALVLPIMMFTLFIWPWNVARFVAYVLMFNMLVGPVFSAGSITGERERQTLDLLLVTLITPWQVLWGKLWSGVRISSVLTSFVFFPIVLAWLLPAAYYSSLPAFLGYTLIVAITCFTTANTALFCSAIFRKTSTSLVTSYLVLMLLFIMPLAATTFANTFYNGSSAAEWVQNASLVSPFTAVFSLPLNVEIPPEVTVTSLFPTNVYLFLGHILFAIVYNGALLLGLMWLFQKRWRVSE